MTSDCLDRTGLVVALLGAEALRDYVRSRGFTYTGSQVEQRYRNLAAEVSLCELATPVRRS